MLHLALPTGLEKEATRTDRRPLTEVEGARLGGSAEIGAADGGVPLTP